MTDVNAVFLPSQTCVEGAPSVLFDTGRYGYDGARDIKQIGSDLYRYDGSCLNLAEMFLYAQRTGFGGDGSSDQPAGAGHGQYWFPAVDPSTMQEFDQSPVIIDDARNTTQNQNPASAPASRNLQYIHRDHLGSTRLMTDENGAEIGRWKYFPFGMEATVEESGDQRMKFTGHERDGEVELDYMLARYCSSSTGRFVSIDPILGGSGLPQSWHRYSYVRSNPTRYIDPTGEYGRGTGFTDKQWKKFDKAQSAAAKKMTRRASKLDKKATRLEKKASKLGKKGAKGMKRAADLRQVAGYLRTGATALQGDASSGYVANAVDSSTYQSMGGSVNGAAMVASPGSPVVTLNMEHPIWSSVGVGSQRVIGHESLHTAGLEDQRGSNGMRAYKFGLAAQREAFRELRGTQKSLVNPDHIMDLVY